MIFLKTCKFIIGFFSDDLKVIHGQGMPSYRHHEHGDLFVHISVKFPDSLSPDVVPLLEKALPPRNPVEKFTKSIHTEEVEMDEVDARQRERAQGGGGEAMDEDEGEPRVQCANQ